MSSNSSNNSRMGLLVGVFAVVIAAVAYVGIKFPIPEENTSGTIMPAERYRGDQLSSDDVVLGDESLSQLMQTDLYQRITTDSDFADALSSESFQDALQNEAFQDMLQNEAFADALQSDAMQDALRNEAFQDALQSDAFQGGPASLLGERMRVLLGHSVAFHSSIVATSFVVMRGTPIAKSRSASSTSSTVQVASSIDARRAHHVELRGAH